MVGFGIPVEGLVAQDDEEGINIAALKVGFQVSVETLNSIYTFHIVDGRNAFVTGGMRSNGDVRYPKPVPAQIIGSLWYDKLDIEHIKKGTRLAFRANECDVSTSPVMDVKIEGPDQEWSYSMGWRETGQSMC